MDEWIDAETLEARALEAFAKDNENN